MSRKKQAAADVAPWNDDRAGENRALMLWSGALSLVYMTGPDSAAMRAEVAAEAERLILEHPDVRPEAVWIHLARTLRPEVPLLEGEDPRRKALAVELFRTAVLGLEAIARADDEAELVRRAAAERPAPKPVPEKHKTLRRVRGPLAPSGFARAMKGQKD